MPIEASIKRYALPSVAASALLLTLNQACAATSIPLACTGQTEGFAQNIASDYWKARGFKLEGGYFLSVDGEGENATLVDVRLPDWPDDTVGVGSLVKLNAMIAQLDWKQSIQMKSSPAVFSAAYHFDDTQFHVKQMVWQGSLYFNRLTGEYKTDAQQFYDGPQGLVLMRGVRSSGSCEKPPKAKF